MEMGPQEDTHVSGRRVTSRDEVTVRGVPDGNVWYWEVCNGTGMRSIVSNDSLSSYHTKWHVVGRNDLGPEALSS